MPKCVYCGAETIVHVEENGLRFCSIPHLLKYAGVSESREREFSSKMSDH